MEINENVVYSQKALHDINLVERAINGDQTAYTELLSRYRDGGLKLRPGSGPAVERRRIPPYGVCA